MAVKHIFLALLSKKPMHGYDIKHAFEELLSGQWALNFGQVYTTLTRLERDGLIEIEEIKSEDKTEKKIYRLTEDGQVQLDQWLKQEAEWSVFQDEISFQISAYELIDRDKAAELLKSYQSYLLQLIGELVQKKKAINDEGSLTTWIFERNIMKAEADLKWVELYLQNREK